MIRVTNFKLFRGNTPDKSRCFSKYENFRIQDIIREKYIYIFYWATTIILHKFRNIGLVNVSKLNFNINNIENALNLCSTIFYVIKIYFRIICEI